MSDPTDELRSLMNNFHLGAYQAVVNEALNPATTPRSEGARLLRTVYLYRAYTAQNKLNLVLSEITPQQPAELRAVRILAGYLQSPQNRESTLASAKELAATEVAGKPAVAVVLATVFYHDGAYDEALKLLAMFPKDLECAALTVQTLLKLNRLDLARSTIATIKTWAEDASLAQLAEAWVNLAAGGEQKAQESYYIFEELASPQLVSSKLVTGQAACRVLQGKPVEAEQLLMDSLNRDSTNPETLVNLIVAAQLSGKPADLIARYTNALRDSSPSHPYLADLALKESLFDRSATRYQTSF
ncbi:hypothetical protein HDU93_002061 [Gonapodya sp. JEL0774]|nr:hypothetical protein HDU93_002061 [Gonapodya sp. JEL0774]